jgi:hypothetical protein
MSPGDAYETSTTTIQVGSATQLVTVTLTAVVDLPAGVCRFYAQALSD